MNTKIEAAVPHHHQEMNSICEQKWQEVHNTAHILLNTARLGGAFFRQAHKYAVDIINALPARNVVNFKNN